MSTYSLYPHYQGVSSDRTLKWSHYFRTWCAVFPGIRAAENQCEYATDKIDGSDY